MESAIPDHEAGSFLSLLSGLREDVRDLFHEEVQLAKKEFSEKASVFGRNSVYFALGGLVACLALTFLMIALGFLIASGLETLGIQTGVALCLGFLAIAVVAGVTGGILVCKALSAFKKNSFVPERTLETLREIKQGGLDQAPVVTKRVPPPEPKDTRSSDQIRSDVERTRGRIGREVRGLRTQLQMATIAMTVLGQLRRNPVRSVGIGVGTGLAGLVLMKVARVFGRRII